MKNKISRRNFLKLVSSTGVLGTSVLAAGCSGKPSGGTGWMPNQYEGSKNYPIKVKGRIAIDSKNPSIMRDDAKCILCGQCLEVCQNVMSVYGSYELPIKDDTPCVHCGQCTLWCPTGAITEKSNINEVVKALNDPTKFVIVQTAPATRVGLGEEFGLEAGTIVEGKQVAALKKIGFDAVVDTTYSADLTIMEEASEVAHRVLKEPNKLPQFTSCCPGWVKFCEYFGSDIMEHLSSCKSPQQMLGPLIKTYYAKHKNIHPKDIVSVSIMPCTAKKYECNRPEMNAAGIMLGDKNIRDVDYVLTTRELARLIKMNNIDLTTLEDTEYDSILGEGTGAGKIFGTTGGVMEAAVRTLYWLVTKQDPPEVLLDWQAVRGLAGVKEASANVPGVGEVKVAVCSGLKNARIIMERIRNHTAPWQFVEFMACPGGCIAGGGQPRTSLPPSDEVRTLRMQNLYKLDSKRSVKRLSHTNKEVQDLYDQFLEKPLSKKAEQLLHTHYTDRSYQLTIKNK
ncbi:[FeFe] hydrogenase, group A [Anaerosinus gibii]|uniref:[FeFe] hydrogenase, group A n=1 Tax=Selenobaculum gibii TaxID=3054208 RepID=A0A9Y2AJX6_9FIRM|nr:[FeFe] hydrogenase, group A [Selenobaculum gbiensis]WIW71241.1 [FeFe] hydrogenase, group A [Selenobaculum gbiensis]